MNKAGDLAKNESHVKDTWFVDKSMRINLLIYAVRAT